MQPLAIVNNAAYVQPAMLVQNEPAYVRPAVLPTDVMVSRRAALSTIRSGAERVVCRGGLHRCHLFNQKNRPLTPPKQQKAKLADMKNKAVSMLAAKKAAPAAAVAPVYVQQAPVAMAPIYASGVALPVTQPYLFVPVRGLFEGRRGLGRAGRLPRTGGKACTRKCAT